MILKKHGQSGGASWWRVGYQGGLPPLVKKKNVCIHICYQHLVYFTFLHASHWGWEGEEQSKQGPNMGI